MTTTHVVLSGGMDSTALLAMVAARATDEVRAVTFDYGQRHARELEAATRICAQLGVPHRRLSLDGLLHGSALLFDGDVPHGHYAADTMARTVVSGRNLLFASTAVAQANPGDTVALAVHTGDHAVYPDCRPGFWEPLIVLVRDAYDVELAVPFLHVSKADIVALGTQVDAPFADSWSCYEGGEVHCGRCGTCVERAEAFHLAGVPDPTAYADPAFWREAVGA